MTERKPIPAAVKLAKDAEAQSLRTTTRRSSDDVFVIVTVTNPTTKRGMYAEWWDGSLVREFNYAATFTPGDKNTKRAPSLKAARAHVGL